MNLIRLVIGPVQMYTDVNDIRCSKNLNDILVFMTIVMMRLRPTVLEEFSLFSRSAFPSNLPFKQFLVGYVMSYEL